MHFAYPSRFSATLREELANNVLPLASLASCGVSGTCDRKSSVPLMKGWATVSLDMTIGDSWYWVDWPFNSWHRLDSTISSWCCSWGFLLASFRALVWQHSRRCFSPEEEDIMANKCSLECVSCSNLLLSTLNNLSIRTCQNFLVKYQFSAKHVYWEW